MKNPKLVPIKVKFFYNCLEGNLIFFTKRKRKTGLVYHII